MAYINDKFAPMSTDGSLAQPPVRYQELTANGAITIACGLVVLNKAGVLAATLDDPPLAMNGAELTILAIQAQANTVTNTTGFGGGTTNRDVATFGGAISDNITLIAWNGVWYVKSTRNVTLG